MRNPFDRSAPRRRPIHSDTRAALSSAARAPGAFPFRRGTLQRASADAAARLAAGVWVDSRDINDGRVLFRAAPFLVVTAELREQRGWPAREPSRRA